MMSANSVVIIYSKEGENIYIGSPSISLLYMSSYIHCLQCHIIDQSSSNVNAIITASVAFQRPPPKKAA